MAAAALKDGATLELAGLREFCGERITHYKGPHERVIVDAIPRNPSGKILKRTVREKLLSS